MNCCYSLIQTFGRLRLADYYGQRRPQVRHAFIGYKIASPRTFIYNQDSGRSQIDVRAPVYDIRGAFKEYQCGKPILGGGAYTATHNCNLYEQPQAAGTCYRDTFGDWHCLMTGNRLASTNQVREQMPPR